MESSFADDWVLVVYLPDCHESLAGIVAGRLRERYHKPSIVLTPGEEAVKGSGRSIEGYHMFQALTEADDLLLKYGGHPMAAGLSLPEENIESYAVAVSAPEITAEELASRLRELERPVIGRISGEKLLLDMRTIREEDMAYLESVFRDGKILQKEEEQ